MKSFVAVAALAVLALSGCTFFQDDIYKAQAGYYGSSAYADVEAAIHDEFAARFGTERLFRADVEWKYDHWTCISDQRAIGHDKYRTRVSAYPQLGADGTYEPVVVARKEVYTGYAFTGRGGPTAMYSGKWSEVGRDVNLEADLANGIYARIYAPEATGGGK